MKKKTIAVLGSTGSIGQSTLDIIKKTKEFKVELIIANKNYQKIINQTQLHFTRNHFVKTLDVYVPVKVGKNHPESVTIILVITNLTQLLDIILHHLMIAMF